MLGILSADHQGVAAARRGCGYCSTNGLSSSPTAMKSAGSRELRLESWGRESAKHVTLRHLRSLVVNLSRLRAPGGAGRRPRSPNVALGHHRTPVVTMRHWLRQVVFFFAGGRRVIYFFAKRQTAYIFSRQVSPCATRRHHLARTIAEVCGWSTIQVANPSESRRYSMDISKSPELERRAGRQGSMPIKESNEPFRKHRRRRPIR